MKGGAKGGGGVEIDLKTSSLSNGFNFPLETALWVFFSRKTSLMKNLFVFSRLQRSFT